MKYEYYYFINICYPKNIYTQRNLIEIKLKSDCIYHFQIDLKSIWTSVWIKTDVRLDPNQSKNMRICVYILGKSKHLICVHIFVIKNIIILSIFCMYFFFSRLTIIGPSNSRRVRWNCTQRDRFWNLSSQPESNNKQTKFIVILLQAQQA